MLIGPTSLGPPGGPQSTPGGYAEKNFVFERGVQTTQNALICLDPLTWKTLFWRKKLKFFILVDFYAKMVKIADLEHSADANSGMRQVKCFFLHILVNLMTIRRGFWKGGPKIAGWLAISHFSIWKEKYETYTFLKKRSTFASF